MGWFVLYWTDSFTWARRCGGEKRVCVRGLACKFVCRTRRRVVVVAALVSAEKNTKHFYFCFLGFGDGGGGGGAS